MKFSECPREIPENYDAGFSIKALLFWSYVLAYAWYAYRMELDLRIDAIYLGVGLLGALFAVKADTIGNYGFRVLCCGLAAGAVISGTRLIHWATAPEMQGELLPMGPMAAMLGLALAGFGLYLMWASVCKPSEFRWMSGSG